PGGGTRHLLCAGRPFRPRGVARRGGGRCAGDDDPHRQQPARCRDRCPRGQADAGGPFRPVLRARGVPCPAGHRLGRSGGHGGPGVGPLAGAPRPRRRAPCPWTGAERPHRDRPGPESDAGHHRSPPGGVRRAARAGRVAGGRLMAALQIRPRNLLLRAGVVTGTGLRVGVEGFWLRFGDGLGEVTLLPDFGSESLDDARRALEQAAEALQGGGPATSPEEIEQRIDATPARARAPASRAGVELALLDAASRHAGQPLAGWLGAAERVVRVNALLIEDTPQALAAAARARVREGFETIKVKVGSASPEVDHQRLKAVREAIGPDLRLRIDGNGAWTEAEARQRLIDCAPFRLEYCEQPVAAENVDGLRRLRSLARVAADETLGLSGSEELLLGGDRPAVDVLVFKL